MLSPLSIPFPGGQYPKKEILTIKQVIVRPTTTALSCSLGASMLHIEMSLHCLPRNGIPDQEGTEIFCTKGLGRCSHRWQMWGNSMSILRETHNQLVSLLKPCMLIFSWSHMQKLVSFLILWGHLREIRGLKHVTAVEIPKKCEIWCPKLRNGISDLVPSQITTS